MSELNTRILYVVGIFSFLGFIGYAGWLINGLSPDGMLSAQVFSGSFTANTIQASSIFGVIALALPLCVFIYGFSRIPFKKQNEKKFYFRDD